MKTIWKYRLEVTDKQHLLIPRGSEILCVQTQFDTPCVWVSVPDTDADLTETVSILMFGTGQPIFGFMDGYEYLGTFQIMGGSLVFHVFYNYK
jgi:hypothetical protein